MALTKTNGQPRRRKTRDEMRKQVLHTDPTRDYNSTRFTYYGELFVQNLPLWRLWTARMMLTSDPIVNFSLNIRNAALMAAEVIVTGKNEKVMEWVKEQWDFMWNNHRPKLVSAKKWGFAPLQMLIGEKKGLLVIKKVKDFAPEDGRALEQRNRLVGMRVKGIPVYFPQALWLSFGAEFGNAYGIAVTRRQYPAWYEKWMAHGAKRLQQLRMIKDAWIGDIFWYPPNMLIELPDGTKMSWKDLMREIGENRLSGGALTLPRLYDSQGKELTGYQPPTQVPGATEIFAWVEDCDQNILKGADIPSEVVQAADTGSGFSGRSIPFLVLLSVCNGEFVEIVQAVTEQVLRPLAWLNWGGDVEFEVKPKSLVESFAGDIQGSSMAGSSIGGPMQQGQPAQLQQQPQQNVQFGEVDDAVDAAANTTEKPASQKQAEAGTYKKGKVNLHGLTISIENAKGTKRRPEWPPLSAHYGYINKTEGKDGDHVDCFIGPDAESEIVFVIDQQNASGRFDEHKCVLGTLSESRARALYLANYPKNWECGPVTAMTVPQFKAWLEDGNTTKPVNRQVSQFEEESIHDLHHIAEKHHGKAIGGTGPLRIRAYRAGELKDHHGRGIFFGHSHEAVAGYQAGHGQQSKEHVLHIKNAIHAPGHEELHKHLHGTNFWKAIEHEDRKLDRAGHVGNTLHQAQRNVERKMARKAHAMGHDAIIYTKPGFLKAGNKHGPEIGVIGHAAKGLEQSQHEEAVDFKQEGQLHAPPGGVTIHGVKYKGGEFIPKEVIDAMSPEDKAKLRSGSIARHIKARPELAKDRPGKQAPKDAKRQAPGSQMSDKLKNQLRDFGMIGTFPPADVPMENVKVADFTQDPEELKYKPLMSWVQTTKSGRQSPQYRYTKEFMERNAEEKFERVNAIEPHLPKIEKFLSKAIQTKTLAQKDREAAGIANVIRETGLRPTDGNDSVKHGHFGISSIQTRHAKVKGDEIHLDFIGKEGVRNRTVMRDPTNVAFLKELLATSTGPRDFIFKNANSRDAAIALKKITTKVGGPEDIKLKDLRTVKATQTARAITEAFDGPPPPLTGNKKKDEKLINKAIVSMSEQVSKVLNNTPMQARTNYIHPQVIMEWRKKLTG